MAAIPESKKLDRQTLQRLYELDQTTSARREALDDAVADLTESMSLLTEFTVDVAAKTGLGIEEIKSQFIQFDPEPPRSDPCS